MLPHVSFTISFTNFELPSSQLQATRSSSHKKFSSRTHCCQTLIWLPNVQLPAKRAAVWRSIKLSQCISKCFKGFCNFEVRILEGSTFPVATFNVVHCLAHGQHSDHQMVFRLWSFSESTEAYRVGHLWRELLQLSFYSIYRWLWTEGTRVTRGLELFFRIRNLQLMRCHGWWPMALRPECWPTKNKIRLCRLALWVEMMGRRLFKKTFFMLKNEHQKKDKKRKLVYSNRQNLRLKFALNLRSPSSGQNS